MAGSVKRVTFAKNAMGMAWLDINVKTWKVIGSCGNGGQLVNRACRLSNGGKKLEYRTGSTYTTINAAIEQIA